MRRRRRTTRWPRPRGGSRAAGYSELVEPDEWRLAPGDRRYVVRDGSVIAFELGSAHPAEAGFRIVGAHTDSPNLRLKPNAAFEASGYRQLAIEPYGGVLLHTWLDRDLSLAGRVSVLRDGRVETLLVDLERPLLRVAELAIHLQRELREQGLKLNAQTQMAPIIGLVGGTSYEQLLVDAIEKSAGFRVEPRDVAGHELMAYDTTLAADRRRERRIHFLGATRQPRFLSRRRFGACSLAGRVGSALSSRVDRSLRSRGGRQSEPQRCRRPVSHRHPHAHRHRDRPRRIDGAGGAARAASLTHRLGRHGPCRSPELRRSPRARTQARRRRAGRSSRPTSISRTRAMRRRPRHSSPVVARSGVEPQRFVARSDMPCGSTIGPLAATRVGVSTVDVGSPMLSMHSCREMAGTADVAPMIAVLAAFFER